MRRLAPLAFVLLFACGDDAAEDAANLTPTDPVHDGELPQARRNDATPPPGAIRITIARDGVYVAENRVAPLTSGDATEGVVEGALPAVTSAVSGHPAVTVRAHSLTRYRALVTVLHSLHEGGVGQVFFEVSTGVGAPVGYLDLSHFDVRNPDDPPLVFAGNTQRTWAEWVEEWDTFAEKCSGTYSVQCQAKPDNVAEGGSVEFALMTRESGVGFNARRYGVDDEDANADRSRVPPMRTRDMSDEEWERVQEEFNQRPNEIEARFLWRINALGGDASPVTLAMRELCGLRACGLRFRSTALTPWHQIAKTLGAAFPNGMPSPAISFERPR